MMGTWDWDTNKKLVGRESISDMLNIEETENIRILFQSLGMEQEEQPVFTNNGLRRHLEVGEQGGGMARKNNESILGKMQTSDSRRRLKLVYDYDVVDDYFIPKEVRAETDPLVSAGDEGKEIKNEHYRLFDETSLELGPKLMVGMYHQEETSVRGHGTSEAFQTIPDGNGSFPYSSTSHPKFARTNDVSGSCGDISLSFAWNDSGLSGLKNGSAESSPNKDVSADNYCTSGMKYHHHSGDQRSDKHDNYSSHSSGHPRSDYSAMPSTQREMKDFLSRFNLGTSAQPRLTRNSYSRSYNPKFINDFPRGMTFVRKQSCAGPLDRLC